MEKLAELHSHPNAPLWMTESNSQSQQATDSSLAQSAKLWSTPDQTVGLACVLSSLGTRCEVSRTNFAPCSAAVAVPSLPCRAKQLMPLLLELPGVLPAATRVPEFHSFFLFFFFFKFHQIFGPRKKCLEIDLRSQLWEVRGWKKHTGFKVKAQSEVTFAFRHLFQCVSYAQSKVFLITKDELEWNRSHVRILVVLYMSSSS